MRWKVPFYIFVASLNAQPQQPAPTEPSILPQEDLCSLEGIVRHAATGQPLNRVMILLRSVTPGNELPPLSTLTNAEGRFAMKGIDPGPYRISAERTGYVRTEYGARPGMVIGAAGTTIRLERGQNLKSIEISMPPQAVITGRIRDEAGEPVQGVTVIVLRKQYIQNRKQLTPIAQATTNDLGEYRVFGLAAGKYFLSVSPNVRGQAISYSADRSANAVPDEEPVVTYYPGTVDVASATQINVVAGSITEGMDIAMRRVRTFRISGRVLGLKIGGRGYVYLQPKDSITVGPERSMARFRLNTGEFEIRGARPGKYILTTDLYSDPGGRLSGRVEVEVGEHDVSSVSLSLVPAFAVKGIIRPEETSSLNRLQFNRASISLAMINSPVYGGFGTQPRDGGTFSIDNLGPGEYSLQVYGLPAGSYLKSARLGETNLLENHLDLTQPQSGDVSGVELVVSTAAAKLSGDVTGADGNPLRGSTVVLRTANPKLTLMEGLIKTATTDQNGKFEMESLAPGDYRLLAFESIDPADARDPEIFQEYESKSVKLTLKESAQERQSLKAVVRTE
jgi:protocatechuate 3,4-dioxygenase beta subunit